MKTIKVKKGQSFASLLARLAACDAARQWVGKKSLRTAYRQCSKADEILWLAGRLDISRPVLVSAACECARLVLHLVPVGEARPRMAVEMAERWAHGDASVTADMVRAAAYASHAAHAAYAAAYAAYAADDAAYAARAAYAASARAETQAKCLEIVKRHVPFDMLDAAIKTMEVK